MAKSVSHNDPMTESLADIADLCVREWKQLGNSSSHPTASATLTGDRLTITLRDGLTKGDRQLVHYSSGQVVVRRNAMRRVDQFYPQLAEQIEIRLNCFVADSDVALDPATGEIQLSVMLRDVTRAMWPAIALAGDTDASGGRTVSSAA